MNRKEKRIRAAWFDRGLFWRLAALSAVIALVIEMMGRHSPLQGAWFMVSHPTPFVYNALIIFLSLSPALAFRRRLFAGAVPAVVWLGLGVANCVTLLFRVMPLEAIDFAILRTGLAIAHMYLNGFQAVLIAVGVVLLIVGLVVLWRKAPKKQPRRLQALVQTAVAAACLVGFGAALTSSGQLPTDFTDPPAAYEKGGFCYSLIMSMIDRGVDEPEDYSAQSVEEIVAALAADHGKTVPDVLPNIVFLQLESFFDPSYIDGYEFAENPVPVFSALKTRCATGLLTVPGVGSGTANAEFEVLTGMNLDHFGAGEYPFQTILLEKACESYIWNLKELGYGAHAIHNHTGTFYERNNAYPSLGFDTFQPVECMLSVPRNTTGWAKDLVLTREIENALNLTEGPDVVHAVSVQPHGKYPDELPEGAPVIGVTGIEDETIRTHYEFYLGQLREVDNFLSALVNRLSRRGEPTVVVMYGDHLPSIELEEERLTRSTMYQTEYLIWSNYDLPKADRDLETWQLGAHVLQLVGIDSGTLTKLHQRYQCNPGYQDALEMLEYDMLYGENIVYGGQSPYQPTQMKIGFHPLRVTGVTFENDVLTVTGDGFTESSRIRVGQDVLRTDYISNSMLQAELKKLESGDEIVVEQAADLLAVLCESEPFVVE